MGVRSGGPGEANAGPNGPAGPCRRSSAPRPAAATAAGAIAPPAAAVGGAEPAKPVRAPPGAADPGAAANPAAGRRESRRGRAAGFPVRGRTGRHGFCITHVRSPPRPACAGENRRRDPAGVRRGWGSEGGIRAPTSVRRASGTARPPCPGPVEASFDGSPGGGGGAGSASVPTGGGRDRVGRLRVPTGAGASEMRRPSPTSAASLAPGGVRPPPASVRAACGRTPHPREGRDLFCRKSRPGTGLTETNRRRPIPGAGGRLDAAGARRHPVRGESRGCPPPRCR